MDKTQREAIAKRLLERSHADQTEIIVSSNDSALTRFSRGISNQNVASLQTTISVRAIVGNRTGVASTDSTDDPALDQLLARALEMASFAPSDPETPALPVGGATTAPQHAYAEATAQVTPADRANIVDGIMREVERAGAWASGYASTSIAGITIANSSGALSSFDGTDAQANVKVTAETSTGFAESYSADVSAIDGMDIGRRATEKARASANPRSVEPGEWTVILEPPAFGELMAYFCMHFSAQSYDEGSSFFSGALGQTFFDTSVSISDDYAHPLCPGMPFDFEAQPKQRIALVENGAVRTYVTDSYYAKKLKVPNTGHALPAPNAYGPQALNVAIAPGTATIDELIASTKRGLLISRFWYIRIVDQKQAIVTGMTRDGTFLIEKGKVTGGVHNLRFNQSIVDALKSVSFSRDQRRSGGYSYSIVAPTARIEKFAFTSTTEF